MHYFFSWVPTHYSFTFNSRFLNELKHIFLKLCVGFYIFDSVSFLLKFTFLFNKKHGVFEFKTL